MNKMNYLLAAIAVTIGSVTAFGQAPAAPAAGGAAPAAGGAAPAARGGGGGGRGGGILNATPEQTQAATEITTRLTPLTTAVTDARTELATATFAEPRNDNNIKAAVEKVRQAELNLANERAAEFAKLQASANKLTAEQIPSFVTLMGRGAQPAGRGGGGGARGAGGGAAPAAGGAAAPAAGAPRGN